MAANVGVCRFIIFLVIVASASAVDYLKVDFTRTLNADTLTSATYTNFLKELRQKLAATYSKSVPVLPVYSEEKPRGFDVLLTAGTNTVPVRFRGDNLYLVGFQMQTGTKTWIEFGKDNPKPPLQSHLIQGAKFLGSNGSYIELEGIGGKVTDMDINKAKLKASVYSLAVSADRTERAKALLVVIQMISEAARFLHISDHFASNLDNGKAKLPGWMRYDLENYWDNFSYRVLKSEADPCYKFPPPTINNNKIATVEALRGYFGVLYRDPDTLKPPCKSLYDDMKSLFEFEMAAQA